jgi:8-oxo-dGTP pyrophosphatase MutT (NUDIX family)
MGKEVHAVTSFLESEDKILVLLRSERVATYKSRWGGISGVIDGGRNADEQALLEIEEETSLTGSDVELVRKGEPYIFFDEKLCLRKVIYPYLFHAKDPGKIKIDWEHREMRWIRPGDIDSLETMPRLKETLDRVWTWQD